MRALALIVISMCTALAPAAAAAQDAAELRRQIEQLQKELESVSERLRRLEAQPPPAPAPATPAAPPAAAAPPPAATSPSALDLARPREPFALYQQRGAGHLLFDIGIAGDFVGNITQANVERAGGGTFSGQESRFFPREIELSLFGQVDPYASAVVRIEAGEEERGGEIAVNLSEAYFTLLTLPVRHSGENRLDAQPLRLHQRDPRARPTLDRPAQCHHQLFWPRRAAGSRSGAHPRPRPALLYRGARRDSSTATTKTRSAVAPCVIRWPPAGSARSSSSGMSTRCSWVCRSRPARRSTRTAPRSSAGTSATNIIRTAGCIRSSRSRARGSTRSERSTSPSTWTAMAPSMSSTSVNAITTGCMPASRCNPSAAGPAAPATTGRSTRRIRAGSGRSSPTSRSGRRSSFASGSAYKHTDRSSQTRDAFNLNDSSARKVDEFLFQATFILGAHPAHPF